MSRRIRCLPLLPRSVRPAAAAVLAASAALGLLALPALAEEEIVIQPETVISGAPGSITRVSTVPVPMDMVGEACDLRVVTKNGSSVHVGNTVFVTTGEARIRVDGVEDSSLGTLLDTSRVNLGTDIVVEVQLGPDGWSSLGFTVGFECTPESLEPVVQPSQQIAPPPTTEAPTTTELPSTIEVAPPTLAVVSTPTEVPTPTVLPSKVEAPALPQAEPARATTATPNFTG